MDATDIIFAAREVGSGPATRVTVAAPQGSCFNGRDGIVARLHGDDTVFVRFTGLDGRTTELPFARCELIERRGRR